MTPEEEKKVEDDKLELLAEIEKYKTENTKLKESSASNKEKYKDTQGILDGSEKMKAHLSSQYDERYEALPENVKKRISKEKYADNPLAGIKMIKKFTDLVNDITADVKAAQPGKDPTQDQIDHDAENEAVLEDASDLLDAMGKIEEAEK